MIPAEVAQTNGTTGTTGTTGTGESKGAWLRLAASFAWALGCGSLLAAVCLTQTRNSEEPLAPRGLAQGRELFDVNYFDVEEVGTPYTAEPEEAKAIKVTCVIDAAQVVSYLGEAVTAIYRAEICPDACCWLVGECGNEVPYIPLHIYPLRAAVGYPVSPPIPCSTHHQQG